MTLTLQTVEAHIRNALGGDSSVEGNGRSIANQSGDLWSSMHDWRCQERFGRLSLRASITISDGTWTESSRTLTKTSAFTSYTLVQGDEFQATGGADVTTGYYPIQTRSSANAIVLETSIGAAADLDTDVDGTITTNSIGLPSDFRSLISQPLSVDATRSLVLVTPQEVLERRAGQIGGDFDSEYVGAIVWPESAAALGGVPVPRIEIHPTPSANVSNAFVIHYRAAWNNLSDDSDIVPVPSITAIEILYLQIVRAVALGYEEHDVASMSARIEEIRAGPLFLAACRADGLAQPSFGLLRGGAAAMQMADTGRNYLRSTVADPS